MSALHDTFWMRKHFVTYFSIIQMNSENYVLKVHRWSFSLNIWNASVGRILVQIISEYLPRFARFMISLRICYCPSFQSSIVVNKLDFRRRRLKSFAIFMFDRNYNSAETRLK